MIKISKKTTWVISTILIVVVSILAFGMYVNNDKGTKKKIIFTQDAPSPIGPYSQAVLYGETLYISGQLGIHPKTGLFPTGLEDQTRQAMQNLKAILEEAKMEFKDVVQTHIYLKDINDFAKVNEIYSSYFEGDYPSRATMQVAALPKDGKVEIEMIACKAAKK
jgi:2-iminobutanoate/2-iminopropanoate deaminase